MEVNNKQYIQFDYYILLNGMFNPENNQLIELNWIII